MKSRSVFSKAYNSGYNNGYTDGIQDGTNDTIFMILMSKILLKNLSLVEEETLIAESKDIFQEIRDSANSKGANKEAKDVLSNVDTLEKNFLNFLKENFGE